MEPSAIQEDKAHELTASGRRKKPDKWANMLKAKLLVGMLCLGTALLWGGHPQMVTHAWFL